MKTATTKLAPKAQAPVFPKTSHQPRPDPQASTMVSQSEKRDNIFSKSRDTREDRGARQMKTTHNSQTFPHVR